MKLSAGHISLESHFEELKGAVEALLSRPDVDHPVVCAHQQRGGPSCLLLPDSRRNRAVHRTGAHRRPGAGTESDPELSGHFSDKWSPNGAELVSRYHKLIEAFEKGAPFVPDLALPEGANNLVAGLSAPVNQPFSRNSVLQAGDYIKKIREPMLVVIGKKDIQTDWKLDGEKLEEVEGKTDVSFYYPETANHVLKYEPTPRAGSPQRMRYRTTTDPMRFLWRRARPSWIGLISTKTRMPGRNRRAYRQRGGIQSGWSALPAASTPEPARTAGERPERRRQRMPVTDAAST